MTLGEISAILGTDVVDRVQAAFKAAFIAARSHPDPDTAEAALDRLLMALVSAVIAHPEGLETAQSRAQACCDDLRLIVTEACRINAEDRNAADRIDADADVPTARRRFS